MAQERKCVECEGLTDPEKAFLTDALAYFRSKGAVAKKFQIAHNWKQGMAALSKGATRDDDEVLLSSPRKGDEMRVRIVRRKDAKAIMAAAGADPCCFWDEEDECIGYC